MESEIKVKLRGRLAIRGRRFLNEYGGCSKLGKSKKAPGIALEAQINPWLKETITAVLRSAVLMGVLAVCYRGDSGINARRTAR